MFSLKKINLKMLSGKWRPFCRGLNMLKISDMEGANYGTFHETFHESAIIGQTSWNFIFFTIPIFQIILKNFAFPLRVASTINSKLENLARKLLRA